MTEKIDARETRAFLHRGLDTGGIRVQIQKATEAPLDREHDTVRVDVSMNSAFLRRFRNAATRKVVSLPAAL